MSAVDSQQAAVVYGAGQVGVGDGSGESSEEEHVDRAGKSNHGG